MANKFDEKFIIMQATIKYNKQKMEDNKKNSDDKMMNTIEDFKAMLASTIISMMDQINI